MQTNEDAPSRAAEALKEVCAFQVAESELKPLYGINADRRLIGPAEQKRRDTYLRLVSALGEIPYLPRTIRGAVNVLFDLAKIQLGLFAVTQKIPGGPSCVIIWPSEDVRTRGFTAEDYDQLDAALGVLKRELEKMIDESRQEAAIVPVTGDAPVATGGSKPGAIVEGKAHQYITLDSAAGWVGRSKRTLEKYRGRGLPDPAVRGRGGQPDEWIWAVLRPWLEETFNRTLPERLPVPFRAGADRQNLKNLPG